MPQKLRLALVLPVTQVIITAILTLWADRVTWLLIANSTRVPGPYVRVHLLAISLRLIWRGVNGPTCPICVAGSANYLILGFSVGELVYLAAVVVLWYLVGRFLDRRRGLQPPAQYQSQTQGTMIAILTLVWVIILFLFGLVEIDRSPRGSFHVEAQIICALLFVWSFLLIAFPARKLFLAARCKRAQS